MSPMSPNKSVAVLLFELLVYSYSSKFNGESGLTTLGVISTLETKSWLAGRGCMLCDSDISSMFGLDLEAGLAKLRLLLAGKVFGLPMFGSENEWVGHRNKEFCHVFF